MERINLGDINIEVEIKNIKYLHLSVYPPEGKVRIAAPLRMNLDTIRIYAISKLDWIKKQQSKFLSQEREAPREYLTKESHYFLGNRYLLRVIERDAPPKVNITHKTLELFVRPHTDNQKRKVILEEWYRSQLKEKVLPIIAKWEHIMDVSVSEFSIKKMKTKWGTCNANAKRIWLNLELAKKPLHCLEYIIVHEMVHLVERKHNNKFIALMDYYLPEWQLSRQELNSLPIGYVDWR